jgi:hypothetical protein
LIDRAVWNSDPAALAWAISATIIQLVGSPQFDQDLEVLATKTDEGGGTLWQRPVGAWPQIAAYKSGDPKSAASYLCTV